MVHVEVHTMISDAFARVLDVPLVNVTAVPVIVGLAIVGLVPKTAAPDPVSSVSALARFALDGVPIHVRIPVPVVVVAGAAPAPPPMTIAFAASAALDAHVVAPEKYGIPPEVPAIVNAGVVVGVATETMPPVHPTLVTVPVPPPSPCRVHVLAAVQP